MEDEERVEMPEEMGSPPSVHVTFSQLPSSVKVGSSPQCFPTPEGFSKPTHSCLFFPSHPAP